MLVDTYVYRGPELSTDYYLVMSKLRIFTKCHYLKRNANETSMNLVYKVNETYYRKRV